MSISVEAEEIVCGSYSKGHKHEIRVKKTKLSIDPNQPTPYGDYTEFKIEKRDEKDRVKELQGMILKLKQEKWMIKEWNAKQQ